MANATGRKLKVFQAQFGFHDSVVAAPSQAAALRAWGVHQNLFADGQAGITEDPQAVDAARAHPEIPLRRAVGSNEPFELEPTTLPKLPEGPKLKAVKTSPPPKPEPSRPTADRSALDAAEASLGALDARRRREEADLREQQSELERQLAARQAAYVAQRTTATAAVVAARNAYRKAGGND